MDLSAIVSYDMSKKNCDISQGTVIFFSPSELMYQMCVHIIFSLINCLLKKIFATTVCVVQHRTARLCLFCSWHFLKFKNGVYFFCFFREGLCQSRSFLHFLDFDSVPPPSWGPCIPACRPRPCRQMHYMRCSCAWWP